MTKPASEPEQLVIAGIKPDRTSIPGESIAFVDAFPFFDDVHGQILLNQVERDVIDTPEFQRLFRISQLGFVTFGFQGATHTRGAHSIGACFQAHRLVEYANSNTTRIVGSAEPERKRAVHNISPSERVLIRLAALLHDISHGPFSHEIEKKTHLIRPGDETIRVRSHYGPYPKHDDYEQNPVLYVALLDPGMSVIARVLRYYSRPFTDMMEAERSDYEHIATFVEALWASGWNDYETKLLPYLLFHLLVFEKLRDGLENNSQRIITSFKDRTAKKWGLGPLELDLPRKGYQIDYAVWERLHVAWYQPYRHDIIGDTLSADLNDYLRRDCQHLGIEREPDPRLLNAYVLVPIDHDHGSRFAHPLFRCAIDLFDYKRGNTRVVRINDIFRLLDIRHEIHEKAVYHRIVQSGLAMLSRAVLMLPPETRPKQEEIYGFDGRSPALAGDDRFLSELIAAAKKVTAGGQHGGASEAQGIAQRLAERRMFKPLALISADKLPALLKGIAFPNDGDSLPREIAAITDSTYFSPFFLFCSWCIEKLLEHAFESELDINKFIQDRVLTDADLRGWCRSKNVIPKRVIFWVTPYKQLYKDPALVVCVDGVVKPVDQLPAEKKVSDSLRQRVTAALKDAETKYEDVWKLWVFVSDGLFYTGMLAKLLPGHACSDNASAHEEHLRAAQRLIARAVRTAWSHWDSRREELARVLEQDPMDDEEFKLILTEFLHQEPAITRDVRPDKLLWEIVGVSPSQYVHGDHDPKCRDVRYKFDEDVEGGFDQISSLLQECGLEHEQHDFVMSLLRQSQCKTNDFGKEEIRDLGSRFRALPSAFINELRISGKAARQERTELPSFLRALWRRDPGWEKQWITQPHTNNE
jgi:HD domain